MLERVNTVEDAVSTLELGWMDGLRLKRPYMGATLSSPPAQPRSGTAPRRGVIKRARADAVAGCGYSLLPCGNYNVVVHAECSDGEGHDCEATLELQGSG